MRGRDGSRRFVALKARTPFGFSGKLLAVAEPDFPQNRRRPATMRRCFSPQSGRASPRCSAWAGGPARCPGSRTRLRSGSILPYRLPSSTQAGFATGAEIISQKSMFGRPYCERRVQPNGDSLADLVLPPRRG